MDGLSSPDIWFMCPHFRLIVAVGLIAPVALDMHTILYLHKRNLLVIHHGY